MKTNDKHEKHGRILKTTLAAATCQPAMPLSAFVRAQQMGIFEDFPDDDELEAAMEASMQDSLFYFAFQGGDLLALQDQEQMALAEELANQALADVGYTRIKRVADGNCLFDAFAKGARAQGVDRGEHGDVRAEVAVEVCEKAELYENLPDFAVLGRDSKQEKKNKNDEEVVDQEMSDANQTYAEWADKVWHGEYGDQVCIAAWARSASNSCWRRRTKEDTEKRDEEPGQKKPRKKLGKKRKLLLKAGVANLLGGVEWATSLFIRFFHHSTHC